MLTVLPTPDVPEFLADNIAEFERHNAEVIATVPRERLLVFDVKQGWEPLCTFLGVAVPKEAFPRTNSTEEFKARVNARRQQS